MLAVEGREPFGNRNGQRIQNKEDLCLTKIPPACVFIAFQLARVGRSRRLLTVKISRRLFNFLAGWSFGEAQVRPIRHRPEDRVSAHSFLCVLAYYVEWHLRRARAPLFFEDEQR